MNYIKKIALYTTKSIPVLSGLPKNASLVCHCISNLCPSPPLQPSQHNFVVKWHAERCFCLVINISCTNFRPLGYCRLGPCSGPTHRPRHHPVRHASRQHQRIEAKYGINVAPCCKNSTSTSYACPARLQAENFPISITLRHFCCQSDKSLGVGTAPCPRTAQDVATER